MSRARSSVKKLYFYYHKKSIDKFEQFLMTDKKHKNTVNFRRWTENQRKLFAEVLAGPRNNSAISLGKSALKK